MGFSGGGGGLTRGVIYVSGRKGGLISGEIRYHTISAQFQIKT